MLQTANVSLNTFAQKFLQMNIVSDFMKRNSLSEVSRLVEDSKIASIVLQTRSHQNVVNYSTQIIKKSFTFSLADQSFYLETYSGIQKIPIEHFVGLKDSEKVAIVAEDFSEDSGYFLSYDVIF